jgi:hypothetical protein
VRFFYWHGIYFYAIARLLLYFGSRAGLFDLSEDWLRDFLKLNFVGWFVIKKTYCRLGI